MGYWLLGNGDGIAALNFQGEVLTSNKYILHPCGGVLQLCLTMADQPARGPDGQLLDASKITWFNDPDDLWPIHAGFNMQEGSNLFKHNLSASTRYLPTFPGQCSHPV